MAENGPYETERQAHAAALAAVPPEPGHVILGRGGNIRLLFLTLEDAGVVTGSHENKIVAWLANYEDSTVAVVAGWVTRAHEAGKAAALEGAETGWGVRFTSGDHVHVAPEHDEEAARDRAATSLLAGDPKWTIRVVRRDIGPWKEVPNE